MSHPALLWSAVKNAVPPFKLTIAPYSLDKVGTETGPFVVNVGAEVGVNVAAECDEMTLPGAVSLCGAGSLTRPSRATLGNDGQSPWQATLSSSGSLVIRLRDSFPGMASDPAQERWILLP